MPAFISKQPNGLYCRFSTIVDTLTHIDMTEEEYIELCVEEAKEKEKAKKLAEKKARMAKAAKENKGKRFSR